MMKRKKIKIKREQRIFSLCNAAEDKTNEIILYINNTLNSAGVTCTPGYAPEQQQQQKQQQQVFSSPH